MSLDIFKERRIPLDKQLFNRRDMVQTPTSKLDDDAFTRVPIILLNGLESEALGTNESEGYAGAKRVFSTVRTWNARQSKMTTFNRPNNAGSSTCAL